MLIIYIVCLVIGLKASYDFGYCNGNQKGFEECSKIWQSGGVTHAQSNS